MANDRRKTNRELKRLKEKERIVLVCVENLKRRLIQEKRFR